MSTPKIVLPQVFLFGILHKSEMEKAAAGN